MDDTDGLVEDVQDEALLNPGPNFLNTLFNSSKQTNKNRGEKFI